MHRGGHSNTLACAIQKFNPKKTSVKLKLRDIFHSIKIMKNKERLRNCCRLWKPKEKQKLSVLKDPDSSLVQKNDIIGKPGTIQIRSSELITVYQY